MADGIEDEWAIHQLLARYADAVNRRDADDWATLWTDDGVWEVFGSEIAGRERVLRAWSGAMDGFRLVFHVVHGAVLAVEGDDARGRVSLSEQLQTREGEPQAMLALYHDRYRRVGGEWRFARRSLQPLYHGPADLSGPPVGA